MVLRQKLYEQARSPGRIVALVLATALVFAAATDPVRNFVGYLMMNPSRRYSVDERVQQYGPAVEQRLAARFAAAGLLYPAQQLALVAFKDARRLEVYGRMSSAAAWIFLMEYPILAASGGLGPKLREGDQQVPEGIYVAELLNANSKFHLSIRLNYPNAFDRQMAQTEGRTQLGGDIMIHGGAASIGCLAIGDLGAEDLFVLAASVGKEQVRILVSPTDFREPGAREPVIDRPWMRDLYTNLRAELRQYSR